MRLADSHAISRVALLLITGLAGCNGITSPDTGDFVKSTEVFGVTLQATAAVPDAKLLHAASVLAEYLDNDEDGVADDRAVADALVAAEATLVMFGTQAELESFSGNLPRSGQDLQADETFPEGSLSAGRFDATLEEVLHLIHSYGYATAYPNALGLQAGTRLTDAMDRARGGRFQQPPAAYPAGAWYTYDDTTCDYACQAIEYGYWLLTSILGAQDYNGRLAEIDGEWRLNTREKVQATDTLGYRLMTDPAYKLPTILPDGTYAARAFAIARR